MQDYPDPDFANRLQSRLPMIAFLVLATASYAITGYFPQTPHDSERVGAADQVDTLKTATVFLAIGIIGGALLGGGPRKFDLSQDNYKRACWVAVVSASFGVFLGVMGFDVAGIFKSLSRTASLAWLFGIIGYIAIPYVCSDTNWRKRLRAARIGSLICSCVCILTFLTWSVMALIIEGYGEWNGGVVLALLSGIVGFFIPGVITCWGVSMVYREMLRQE